MITIITDLYKRKVYNSINILILLVSLTATVEIPIDIMLSLLICFVIGFIASFLCICGGGDSKLVISLSPLFSSSELIDLFVAILLCGGFLSFFYWIKWRLLPRDLTDCSLPYGVAIISGAHISLYFSQGLAIYL